MPHARLKADFFKAVVSEIYTFATTGNCDAQLLNLGIDSLKFLASDGPELRDLSPKIMEYVDIALLRIYPHMGSAQAPEITGLLEDEIKILEKIANKERVPADELQQVHTFCNEIWVQLRMFERGLQPLR